MGYTLTETTGNIRGAKHKGKGSGGINSKGKSSSADNSYYLFNHVNIVLLYHEMGDFTARIVGFYVEPLSIKHPSDLSTCGPRTTKHLTYNEIQEFQRLPVKSSNKNSIVFSYGVEWKKSDIHWASRWDVYLSMNHAVSDKVHWFPIMISLVIVVLLACFIATVLLNTVYQDISQYNRVKTTDEVELDDIGWKLVHADVFRPPTEYPMILAVFVGTGVQLLVCSGLSIVFMSLGFLTPANRGSILTGMIAFFVLTSSFAGYAAAVVYKSFAVPGGGYQKCTILTAIGYPGVVVVTILILDLVLWGYGSTGAVPITSMLTILVLWFLVSVPLTFYGAYRGFKSESIEYPVITSSIHRAIPAQPWYLHPFFVSMIAGGLPFLACCMELKFIMSSIWMVSVTRCCLHEYLLCMHFAVSYCVD